MAAGPLRVWGFDEGVRGAPCGLRRLCTLLGWKRLPLKEKKECLHNFFIEFPRFIPGGDSALNPLNYCSVNLSPRPSPRRRDESCSPLPLQGRGVGGLGRPYPNSITRPLHCEIGDRPKFSYYQAAPSPHCCQ